MLALDISGLFWPRIEVDIHHAHKESAARTSTQVDWVSNIGSQQIKLLYIWEVYALIPTKNLHTH